MSPGILLFLGTALLLLSIAKGQNDETKLIQALVDNYPGLGGRPVQNSSDALEVQLKLTLLHINSLDQDKKVFTITAWLQQSWTDSFLQWDPDQFGGIDYVLLDTSTIWRPDIMLFNSLGKSELLQSVMAHVTSSGTVIIVEPYIFVSQCPDVTPEDNEPSCPLRFGSWAYDTTRLRVKAMEPSKVDISFFQTSNVYEMIGSEVEAEEKTYPCCPGTSYGHLEFTIQLQKRNPEPEVDPSDSAATTTVAMTTSIAALMALQVALVPLM